MDSDPDGGRTDASSSDFEEYDQVERPQAYRLAEGGEEEFDDEFEFRTCDMRLYFEGGEDGKERFARELGAAMEEIGFAILVGHGIDPELHDEAAQWVIDLFTKPSLEKRLEYSAKRVGSINQGYFPIKETSDIHPDLVEGWVFCRRAFDINHDPGFFVDDFWPIPEAERFFRRLCLETTTLIKPLTESVFRYLGVDPHLYDERLTGTNFGLRLNYYPPISAKDDASGAGRLLGHEDIDLFTLLPAPRVEGLQVLNRKNGKWVRLTAPPGSIIMNTGEYMQRITNDILPATTHRVSKPQDPSQHGNTRVSFPFNVYVWENQILEVLPGISNPKYPPIKAVVFHTNTTAKYYGDGYAVGDGGDEEGGSERI